MKSNRAWLPALAFMILSAFATIEARAFVDCNNERICNCNKACSTPCTPGPNLPVLSCGEWDYPCLGSPNCDPSRQVPTWNVSSSDSDFLLILSSSVPNAVPAAASENR
jgi:hypothetical protein